MNEREEQGTVTEPVAEPVNEQPTEQPVPETRETETEPTEPTAPEEAVPEAPVYAYRWNYEAQRAHDEAENRKKRKGTGVFLAVMAAAFLLVLALLVGVLVFRDRNGGKSGAMTTEQVANAVLPSTVLITSVTDTGYGFGSGFFVSEDGYIVTNYHVVATAKRVTVTLYPTGKTLDATVVGYGSGVDLAVLKVEGKGYPVAKIGNSDNVRVGDTAIAIGNPAGSSAPWSTTQGIISSAARSVTLNGSTSISEVNMIQTDAPVNPGNSGGPLCNDRGEVIGIVTEKLTDYESLGFAIPINGAMEVVETIIRTGSAGNSQADVGRVRPTIGITGQTIPQGTEFTYMGTRFTAPENGVLVASVTAGSGADGVLQPGDVIVSIDGQRVESIEELIEILYSHSAGDRVVLRIYPRGEAAATDVQILLGVAK